MYRTHSTTTQLLAAGILVALASSAFAGGKGKEDKEIKAAEGRMTGGGSIVCSTSGERVTHGFELHCETDQGIPQPNNLQINWGTGNSFHLVALTGAVCPFEENPRSGQPPAPFDTMNGEGVGTYNREAGYRIEFTLTDLGEPGAQTDTFGFTIYRPDESELLTCNEEELYQGGNHQAHRLTGNPRY